MLGSQRTWRWQIPAEIKEVLKAQGVERPSPDEFDCLVTIQTWDASCYKFAHFTDDELADAITAVHHASNGLSRDDQIQLCLTIKDAPIPPIAEGISLPYRMTLQTRFVSFVLTEQVSASQADAAQA